MNRYRRGVRLEYQARQALRQQGFQVARSAGSHGLWDLTAVASDPHIPVLLVQCKQVRTRAALERARDAYFGLAALPPSPHYCRVLCGRVRGSRHLDWRVDATGLLSGRPVLTGGSE